MITLVLQSSSPDGDVRIIPCVEATDIVFREDAGWFGVRQSGRYVCVYAGEPEFVRAVRNELLLQLCDGRQVVYAYLRGLGRADAEPAE